MQKAKFDRQVLSVLPQTVAYEEEPAVALAISQIQNDDIAALVKRHPDRFLGVGTVPLQSPDASVAELRRCMTELGLRGIMIGSNVRGRNFDDPGLAPVWAAAAELGALIFIHPTSPAAADRLKDYYLRNFIGNPLDTTIAAACLVFAGVLERHPDIRIFLSHGGGFLPYQEARFIHGWHEREEAKSRRRSGSAWLRLSLRHGAVRCGGPDRNALDPRGGQGNDSWRECSDSAGRCLIGRTYQPKGAPMAREHDRHGRRSALQVTALSRAVI
jgi:hypothetical protein